jgi:predicted site-specific integrase-resolvase
VDATIIIALLLQSLCHESDHPMTETTKIVQPIGKAAKRRYNQQNPYEQQDGARKAVIYVRVSREEQALGHSLEAQERECKEYLTSVKPNWQLIGIYKDEHTGKTDKRPGFQEMMEIIESGQADTIVCHHLDRFSRNLHDILSYFKQLEARGVILAFAKEDFDPGWHLALPHPGRVC